MNENETVEKQSQVGLLGMACGIFKKYWLFSLQESLISSGISWKQQQNKLLLEQLGEIQFQFVGWGRNIENH